MIIDPELIDFQIKIPAREYDRSGLQDRRCILGIRSRFQEYSVRLGRDVEQGRQRLQVIDLRPTLSLGDNFTDNALLIDDEGLRHTHPLSTARLSA